jgi:hypothetical protein
MTKAEAMAAMREGKKVTHRWFSDNEWMSMQDGKVLTEEGYKHDQREFWRYRTDESWNDGYSLWEGSDAV